jgi:uncharacterized membrane protein
VRSQHRGLARVFTDNAGVFGAFLLSFAVIARLWTAHHRLIEHVGSYDGPFVLLNLAWVLTIVFLPFATQVVAGFSADRLAVATYIGTIAVSTVCLCALTLLVWRRPALRREGVSAADATPAPALVTTGILLVALALGTAFQAVNYFALFLLLLTGPVERLLVRRPGRATDGVRNGAEPVDPDAVEG